MMRWLIATSLRLRVMVVAGTILLIVVGFQNASRAPFDVFPEFAPPLVEVQTEAPGLSTAEVEGLVTVPLEHALNGTALVETIRSKSVLGLSSVVLLFEQGTDLYTARQLVQERLARAATQLPAAAKPPVILSALSSLSRVLKIGVSSSKLSQTEMTTIARWTIRPRLMSIPGVANVAIWGQRDRQLQVLVDPDRLRAHAVTTDEVVTAAREATALGAGGYIDTPNQRLAVSHVSPIAGADDLGRVPVAVRSGVPLRLGDVTDVVEGNPAAIGDAIINDGPGLLLIVEKQPGANTLEVTRQVESALEALKPGLKDMVLDSTIFRPASFIEASIHNLNHALLIGCVLVILVLAFFLQDVRTAIISIVAIPVSLLTAALLLRYRGGTLDTMVLAGLVIALGEVVDDAIIGVENVVRRLRLNRASADPRPPAQVILDASLEVRSSVVFGSLIVVLVFVPVFFLPGLSGTFFRPLALAYMTAIVASLLVALIITPALSLLLLARPRRSEDAPLVRWLKGWYRRLLPPVVARPGLAAAFLAVALGVSAALTPLLGEEFLPRFREYDFLMHWVEKPGTSLEAMSRITVRASRELRSIQGVRNFGAHLGRAEVADEVVGPNFTELWISLDPSVDYTATVGRIQEVVDGYPGLYRDLLTYLRERIKEVLTGTSATIVVRIYGPDLDVLARLGQEVRAALGGIAGVADLKTQAQALVPQVQVRFRPDRAEPLGLAPGRVRQMATTLVQGTKVGEFFDEQRPFDVVVWGTPAARANLDALRQLPIEIPGGGYAPLQDVADVAIVPAPNEITREGGSRRFDVTCNVSGRDLGSVAREVGVKLATLSFPSGYHPEVLGEYAERRASQNRLLGLAGLSLVLILLILHADFQSIRLAALVFLTLPFALIGGVAAAFLDGGVLSLGSLVGFVTVLGIAARNGIMLVSHYTHLEQREGETFGPALVLRGSEERLSPILMTALVTALALLPLVVGEVRSGQEIERPMAVVIVGGLFTSTVLNLFILPALYLRLGRGGATGRQ